MGFPRQSMIFSLLSSESSNVAQRFHGSRSRSCRPALRSSSCRSALTASIGISEQVVASSSASASASASKPASPADSKRWWALRTRGICSMAMDEAKGVVKHVLLAKFKDDIPPERVDELIRDYAGLVSVIEPMKGEMALLVEGLGVGAFSAVVIGSSEALHAQSPPCSDTVINGS